MEKRRDVFQAIADPTRRDILSLIATRPLNLNAIAAHFDISRPAISQHIKILNESGLVAIRRSGRQRLCSIRPQKIREVADWLEPFRRLWEERFENLDNLLEQLGEHKDA